LRELHHVDAEELRRFRALATEEKLEEIFLNGRETNGAVADALRDIARLDERVGALETMAELVRQTAINNLAVSAFIRRWGAIGTAGIGALAALAAAGQAIGLWDQVWQWLGG
jgi:hypothetical protein